MEKNSQTKEKDLITNNNYTREQFEREYQVELFFYNLPFSILIFSLVFLTAYIFNKYIEAVVFLTSFFSLRYKFKTTFHYESVFYCIVTTIALFVLSVIFSPPLTISLLGSVLCGFVDTWALWFIQDRFDYKFSSKMFERLAYDYDLQIEDLLDKIKQYENVDLYKMSEEELRQYAQSKGLSETICDTLVLKVIHNYRWIDIQKQLNFSKDGIRYHKEKIIEKLNIKL